MSKLDIQMHTAMDANEGKSRRATWHARASASEAADWHVHPRPHSESVGQTLPNMLCSKCHMAEPTLPSFIGNQNDAGEYLVGDRHSLEQSLQDMQNMISDLNRPMSVRRGDSSDDA